MTSIVTAAELTAIREMADDYFPDTCTIQTASASIDSTGSSVLIYSNTYTNVPCRVDPGGTGSGSGGESVRNMALEADSMWMLNIPYTQLIGVTDRVIHAGFIYEVKRVVTSQSYATISRAEMVRVNG